MENRMIKKISFVLAFSVVSMTTACSGNTDRNSVGNQVEKSLVTPNAVATESGNVNKEAVTPGAKPSATKELLIYTLNENSKEVESRTALVSQEVELTPELIVNLVTDSLADGMIDVGVDTVTTKDHTVIVSFKSDALPVTATDSNIETAILDVFAQSLADNFKDEYPKVIFRILDKAYSTKQYTFGLNEVYLDGTKTNW